MHRSDFRVVDRFDAQLQFIGPRHAARSKPPVMIGFLTKWNVWLGSATRALATRETFQGLHGASLQAE
jgi:hypothetical protein